MKLAVREQADIGYLSAFLCQVKLTYKATRMGASES